MDPSPPSTVDDGAELVQDKVIERRLSPRTKGEGKKQTGKDAALIVVKVEGERKTPEVKVEGESKKPDVKAESERKKPEVKAESERKKAGKGKDKPDVATEKLADWNLEEFVKDAQYFSDQFGLPMCGTNLYKITDVSRKMLEVYFGEHQRSGYKLSNCAGFPQDEILHLSKIVDGYERPVNGVLAHTFCKGVYLERVLKQPVNWAAYAASKLRNQLLQWQREKKGKPDGPPCVRKLGLEFKVASAVLEAAAPVLPMLVDIPTSQAIVPFSTVPLPEDGCSQNTSALDLVSSQSPAPPSANFCAPVTPSHGGRSLLVSIVESEIAKSRVRVREAKEEVIRMQWSVEACTTAKGAEADAINKILAQIAVAEGELAKVVTKMRAEEMKADDCAETIESEEGRLSDEESNEYLELLRRAAAQVEENISWMKVEEATHATEVDVLKKLKDDKEASFKALPNKLSTLKKLVQQRQADVKVFEEVVAAQSTELAVLHGVLENSCPVLTPTYIPTSIRSVGAGPSLTVCPVCCNGFHCFNWIPVSCGHTYHPCCLFRMLGSSSEDGGRCMACSTVFNGDWLRTWGLSATASTGVVQADGFVGNVRDSYESDTRDLYGKYAISLKRRREVSRVIQQTTSQAGAQGQALMFLSGAETTMSIDMGTKGCDDQSSKMPAVSPNEKGGLGRSRKNVSEDQKEEQDAARKVVTIGPTLSSPKRATFPFSPELGSKIHLKPLLLVKTPSGYQSRAQSNPAPSHN